MTVSVGDALALCDWLNVTVVLGVDDALGVPLCVPELRWVNVGD